MSKANQNFHIYRGESKVLFIAVNDAAGAPVSLADCTMRWWLAKTSYSTIEDGGVLVEKNLADGITVVAGGVDVALLPDDTWLTPNVYYHELKIFLPNGGEVMTCTGAVIVNSAADMRARPAMGASAAVVAGTGTVT